MSKSMLIFDYDGVLMDSVREVAVTAYNMLTGDIVTQLSQLPQKALDLFLRNRFHVQPIGDAPVLMKWCLEKAESSPEKLLTAKEYENILRQVDEPLINRTTRFYDIRSSFKSMDINAWLALNQPVQPIWDLLAENLARELLILTNKNFDATAVLCRHFGLDISNDNVYSGDNGTTKIENMTRIMKRFNKPSYAFIDDSVKNLREIDEYFNRNEKKISLIFATWGYTGPNDARMAGDYGYRVVGLEGFTEEMRN